MQWQTYTSVTAIEPNEVGYQGLTSSRPIIGTATSSGKIITVEPTALVFTGFAIVGTVNTVELRLHVTRLARTQDKVIRLWYDSKPQAANLADSTAADVHLYRWENLDTVWTAEHGVVVDLQPHAHYPSANTVYIRSVELRSI
jgi:hypothetical protein